MNSTIELLRQASNEDLQPLVDYIKKAGVSESLCDTAAYRRHAPDHSRYVGEIYHELRLFGGNSFANLVRQEGPDYEKVLRNAAARIGVRETAGLSILQIEEAMIEKLLREALKTVDGENREELRRTIYVAGLNNKDYRAFLSGTALSLLLAPHLYRVFIGEASFLIANAMAKQLLGQGLRVAGGLALGRTAPLLLGPAGWVIGGVWFAVALAGPAYRVTIPCTLHIAMLRQQWLADQECAPLQEIG